VGGSTEISEVLLYLIFEAEFESRLTTIVEIVGCDARMLSATLLHYSNNYF